jgi:hypothetical protein
VLWRRFDLGQCSARDCLESELKPFSPGSGEYVASRIVAVEEKLPAVAASRGGEGARSWAIRF